MSISDGKPMLETRDLTLKYGHSQILHGISMQARAGEVTCVMGTNGVGKTSLLKAISGSHPRAGGDLSIDGEGIPPAPAHVLAQKGVGYVPQGRDIFPLMTVMENLETGYACLPRSEHFVPDEIFELFPVLKQMRARRGGDLRSPAPHRSIVGVLEIGHRCDAASGQFCRRRQRGPVGLVGVGQLVECVQPLHAVVVTQDPGRVIDAELGKKGRTEPQCVQVHARHGSSTSRQCVLQQILVRRIRPQGVSETLRTENPMPVPLVRSRENVDQIDCGIRPGDIDT